MIKINEALCVGCGWCVKDCVTSYLSIKEPEHKAYAAGDRCLACGHCEAICPREAIEVTDSGYEGYDGFDLENAFADPTELGAFMANIRSVRSYRAGEVEAEKIRQIIDAGRFSPTGCNFQRTGYIVIKDNLKEIAREAALALEGELTDMLSQAINRTTLERIVSTAKAGGDRLFFGAPLVIALTDFKIADGVDIGIAAGRMELMANALGLGACYNGIFPKIVNNSPEIAKLVGLASNRKVVTSIMLGYPSVSYMRPPKRKRANIKEL